MVGEKIFLGNEECTCLSKVTYDEKDYYMFSNDKVYVMEGNSDFIQLEEKFKDNLIKDMLVVTRPLIDGQKIYF
ncbi:MAG: hypothetical protein RSA08_03450 [Clostridia bacterium]